MISCDYKDIDRRIFITAIGIDTAPNNKITVVMKAALTKEKGQTMKKNFKIILSTADSIDVAFRQAKALSPLEPDFGHLKTIVFGKDYFENGNLKETISFFMKRRDFQKLAFMLVGSPSAKAIMEFQPEGEDIAGSALFLRFGQGSKSQYSKKAKMSDLYTAISTPGITPIMSLIEIENEDYRIDKMVVFDKNFKVVDILNKEEARTFNIVRHQIDYGLIHTVNLETNQEIGANIQKTNVEIEAYNVKNAIQCNINVKMKVSMELGRFEKASKQELIKSLEKQLKTDIEQLVKKLQDDKADPLRIELSYWQKNKDYEHADKWNTELFPASEVLVNVEIELGGEGVTD
jgi:spore germination protein KC